MKMRFRLTALLLAVMTLLTTATPALATTLDLSTYQQMLDRSAGGSEPIINEGGQVYTMDNTAAPAASGYDSTTTVQLAANAAGSETEQSVTLPYYGKVVLASAIGNGQWQVQVGDQWVNMHGETASTLEVTLAKVQSLFEMNDCAKLRHVAADGSAISNVASIELSYNEQASVAPLLQATVRNAVAPLAEGEEEGETGTVSVRVRYKIDNVDCAEPWSAQLNAGDDLISPVIGLPEVEGYEPTSVTPNDSTVKFKPNDANTIQLFLEDVQESLTYTVSYSPAQVPFVVNHNTISVGGDLKSVTLKESETINGKRTNDPVGAGLAKNYEGFTPLWYDETTKIAADGSTVVNIYYERNWYLMTFDLNGGYGVDPIYAEYEDTITVGTPKKTGYSFVGWSLAPDSDSVSELPGTMPAHNSTYYAVWKADATAKVTVVFWGENADDEGYSYLADSTKVINLKPGKEFTYTEAEMLVCDKEVHTHDDCIGCGKTEHTHSVLGGSCYTLNCTETSHAHSPSCYAGASTTTASAGINAPSSPQNGYVYRREWSTNQKAIYINGSWYEYTGSTVTGSVAPTICGKEEKTHTHTNECYDLTCNTEEHTHDNKCYTCGKEVHTHNSDCYMQGAGLDTTKWKFVKSDTITVAADGSSVVNVYYDRVEYSVQFYTRGNNPMEHTDLKITAKWGAYVGDKWPTIDGSANWYVNPQSVGNSNPMQARLLQMPVGGDKFYGPKTSGNNTLSANYYVEKLDSTNSSSTSNYVLHHNDTIKGNSPTVTTDDMYEIEGFTFNGNLSTKSGSTYNNAKFYYTRNSYKLTFNDQYNDVKNETVKFEAPLSTYKDYVPELPSAYEPGSVEFGGWYQNPQCTGEEYKLEDHKMPSNDIILYAKWVLVKHTVAFYVDQDELEGEAIKTINEIEHYQTLPEDDPPPTEDEVKKAAAEKGKYENYSFIGWFYMDGNEEKAFADSMPITKDLKLYGKWSAREPIPFTIYYKLLDENGNETNINVADPTVSQALDGVSITVDAKTGNDLYEEYRTGCFPMPPSHTVEVTVKKDTSFTFWYRQVPAVDYKVVYVKVDRFPTGAGTFNVISSEEENLTTNSAIVTASFKRYAGWRPDAYQKRLIVAYPGTTTDDGNWLTDAENASNEAENIIFFYYIRDTENALWAVTHYTEPLPGGITDKSQWTEYATSSQTGTIGDTKIAEQKTIEGFTYCEAYVDRHTVTVAEDGTEKETTETTNVTENRTAVLPNGGMEFRLYYQRNKYPVKVEYIDRETMQPLADPEVYTDANGNNLFYYQAANVQVENTKAFHGYELVNDPVQRLPAIQADDAADVANVNTITKNVVTFYYKKTEVEIKYVAVAPDGHQITTDEEKASIGYVTPEAEFGDENGKVTALDGPVTGSTATAASSTYKFVGWYTDEKCTQQVPDSWLDSNKMIPQKEDSDGDPDTNDMLYKSATYYAKFEYNITTLTIKKTGMNDDETAIFTVKATTENQVEKTFTVAVPNDGEVTLNGLLIGSTYKVEEKGDWTWRYTSTCTNASGTLVADGNTVTFNNTKTTDQWLDDEARVHNNFSQNSSNQ